MPEGFVEPDAKGDEDDADEVVAGADDDTVDDTVALDDTVDD